MTKPESLKKMEEVMLAFSVSSLNDKMVLRERSFKVVAQALYDDGFRHKEQMV